MDDDNDDVRETLAGRINELNSALRKANASIKLMRQANHTLKVRALVDEGARRRGRRAVGPPVARLAASF